jgi:hypothetical protein
MKHDMISRKTTMILNNSIREVGKFINTCDMGEELDIRSDPFAFLSCALSQIIDGWAQQSETYFKKLRHNVSTYRSCVFSSSLLIRGRRRGFPP